MDKNLDLKKLKKMLCPKLDCQGYIYPSIMADKTPIYRCKDCGDYMLEESVETLTLLIPDTEIDTNNEEKNVEELNNI